MTPEFLALLRCPYCRGSFAFKGGPEGVPARKPMAESSGVLRCGCSAFPVIDGIPVIQKAPVGLFENTSGHAQTEGAPISELVRLIEAGRPLEALLSCLDMPSKSGTDAANRLLPWRIAHGKPVGRLVRLPFRRKLQSLLSRRESVGVRELLEAWFHPGSLLGPAMGHYFLLRFCQPRHLAALSLLEALPPAAKPVLDIACGLGHLEHYLALRSRSTPCVGTDMNFFHVWIARHWFAPRALYVCANAGEGLPFADNAFSAALCSDAYHYIPNREALLKEIARCAPGAPVLLTRVGNKAVMPNEGAERDLEGWLEECGGFDPEGPMVFGEEGLLAAYLAGRNPFARGDRIPAGIAGSKWLTFAWNVSPDMRAFGPDAGERPHTVGRLARNPIYQESGRAKGHIRLRFEFPLPWYAYENHAMLAYHPRFAEVPDAGKAGYPEWRGKAELAKLAAAYVLIGLPERF